MHIPFCQRKCPYCDFVSYPLEEEGDGVVEGYLSALLDEISLRRRWLAVEGLLPDAFHSLYIGGGTPSILTTQQLTRLLEAVRHSFPITPDAEVTLEINPGTISEQDGAAWHRLGINRLSMGVQSLDDQLLVRLDRIHSVRDVYRTVEIAQRVGLANLSFDLMFALPGQSLDQWQDSLIRAVDLQPTHISCYELTIEPGTRYGCLYDEGKLEVPSEDLVIEMMEWTQTYLSGRGYVHYEISNYALPGFKSRHNQIYWQNRWYLGLGVAAFSYWGQRRWGNTAHLGQYTQWIANGKLPESSTEVLDVRGQLGETVMLGLRLAEGVSLAELQARFGISVWEIWEEELNVLLRQGLVELVRGRLRLTARGLLLANQVQSAFVGSS